MISSDEPESEAERVQQRNLMTAVGMHIDLVTSQYEKATAYSNLVMMAGYAGYFGLWHLTKELVTARQSALSALFMLASLTAFVLFEVGKMCLTSTVLFTQIGQLNDPACRADPRVLAERVALTEAKLKRLSPCFTGLWAISVAVSVVTGLIGSGVLFYALTASLWRAA